MSLGGVKGFAGGGGGQGPAGPGTLVGAASTDSIALAVSNPGISNILSATLLIGITTFPTNTQGVSLQVYAGASPGLIGYIPTGAISELTSSVLQFAGTGVMATGTKTIQVNQASGTTSGYLSFTDWNTFNSKQPALGYTAVPQTRIVGTTFPILGGGDLTADRQLSMNPATGSTGGFLTAADWTTFNSKQQAIGYTAAPVTTTIGGTYPLFGGGDLSANRQIGINPATGTTAGFMDITAQTFAGNKTFLGWVNTPALQLQGASSGFLSHIVGASLAGYTLTWPIAQGGASSILMNNGSGGATWAILAAAAASTYEFIGSAKILGTGAGTWSKTGSSLAAFGTQAAFGGPTVILNPGTGTIQTTDTDLPRFTVNGLAAGTYKVTIDFYGSGSGSGQVYSYAINDGTTTGTPRQFVAPAAGRGSFVSLVEFFTYGASGNKTFEVYGATGSGTVTIEVDGTANGGGDMFFSIERVA